MDIRQLSEGLAVCGQLLPEQMSRVAELGFKSVICNRPDGEEPRQPAAAEIERAAVSVGLQWCYQPVAPAQYGADDVSRFASELERLPGPVLAFCRTGNRSVSLWSLMQARQGVPAAAVLRQVAAAGYDLSALAGRLAAERCEGEDSA